MLTEEQKIAIAKSVRLSVEYICQRCGVKFKLPPDVIPLPDILCRDCDIV